MKKINKDAENFPVTARTNTLLQGTPNMLWASAQFFGLTAPGDTLNLRVTETSRLVMKLNKSGRKTSFTGYPSTGTIVATGVIKDQ